MDRHKPTLIENAEKNHAPILLEVLARRNPKSIDKGSENTPLCTIASIPELAANAKILIDHGANLKARHQDGTLVSELLCKEVRALIRNAWLDLFNDLELLRPEHAFAAEKTLYTPRALYYLEKDKRSKILRTVSEGWDPESQDTLAKRFYCTLQ